MADILKLKQSLSAYTGDTDTLNQFVATATAELGDDWVNTIYDTLTDLSEDERAKLDHAYQYYAATMAWNEAQSYLSQEIFSDVNAVSERVPILEHWLAFFQEPGLQIVEQLKQKLAASQSGYAGQVPVSGVNTASSMTVENGVAGQQAVQTAGQKVNPVVEEVKEEKPRSEAFWLADKIQRQVDMTKWLQAWVAARCIELGNKETFMYPHYGLLVDLMKQTRNEIQKLLESEAMLAEVTQTSPDAVQKLQDYQISLDKDLEIAEQNGVSDETTLISDELTGDDARRILGQLDTSKTPEFLGPAPDGFEVISDSDTELDEQPIKDEYSQIENVVLSEQAQNDEKNTSQTTQNSVKKKLSFSLGSKKPVGT